MTTTTINIDDLSNPNLYQPCHCGCMVDLSRFDFCPECHFIIKMLKIWKCSCGMNYIRKSNGWYKEVLAGNPFIRNKEPIRVLWEPKKCSFCNEFND